MARPVLSRWDMSNLGFASIPSDELATVTGGGARPKVQHPKPKPTDASAAPAAGLQPPGAGGMTAGGSSPQ